MDELLKVVASFLAQQRTASLATVDDAGRPHVANIQYAVDDQLRLLWVSSAQAAHSRHLALRPDAALAVYAGEDQPVTIRGVQFHGQVRSVAQDQAWELYARRFPFVASGPWREAVRSQTFYRVTPTWLRWIDNRVRFGFKREIQLDGCAPDG